MVRLTAEIILRAPAFINPVKERELDLRGYSAPAIENMGTTQDQFDTIDLSDNAIVRVDGFPHLKRLTMVILCNNVVERVAPNLADCVPNLHTLILSNNRIKETEQIDMLEPLKKLTTLSLLGNPVIHHPNYRLYVIHKLPTVRLLDFRKVKQKERQEARRLFGKKKRRKEKGDDMMTAAAASSSVLEGVPEGPTKAEREAIAMAIRNASSLEEVNRLQQLLQSGISPADAAWLKGLREGDGQGKKEKEMVEEMETES